jgi:ppGpp synthetase/RelA/SpoT-type nucleotidyltranferase
MATISAGGEAERMDEAAALEAGRVYETQRTSYQEFGDAIRSLVSQLCHDEDIVTDSVTCRIKKTASLIEKLQREERYLSLDDLTDKVGIRVVTRYLKDVDRVCEVLSSEFRLLEDVTHGSESVESFGYASRHLILRISDSRKHLREWKRFADVVVEVQVRSILQHAWASISHGLDYKSSADVPKDVRRRLFRVAALLETGDELFDAFREQVDSLKDSYRGDVARDDWRQLPVDFESMRAATGEFHLDALRQAAIQQGWSPGNPDNMHDRLLSRVTAVSEASGVKTLGEIYDIADRAEHDQDWLRRVGKPIEKIRPAANPLDIVTLRILSENPSQVAAQSLDIFPQLVDAALNQRPSEA